MTVRPTRRSLVFLAAFPMRPRASGAQTASRHALVVGNGAYRGVPALANPPRDATVLARVLTRLGFTVQLVLDAERAAMRVALERLGQDARGAEAALFFYAGHAAEVGGRNLLFPVDVSARSDTALLASAIPFEMVTSALDGRARTNLIILDSCRDNPLGTAAPAQTRRGGSGAGATRSVGGLAPVRSSVGTLIAFATAPGEVALDGTGDHSPFTTALLRHIETPDVEVRAMLTRVRRSVHQATGGRQVPWDNSSLVTNFFFVSAPGRGGVAAGPTARTLEEAASLGIPLPSYVEGLRFNRENGPASGLVGVWTSGTRRYGGTGRHAMLIVVGVRHVEGTATVIVGSGPPTAQSADQLAASAWQTLARLQDLTLSWTNRAGYRFSLVPVGPNEARMTVERDGITALITLRRLE